ncbi:hypothetical protein B0H67DRAFT_647947 [Lasiosphaeris hirsuta]|uniref:Uncharacterized protein n=1 Tax=Lasiosphaeris hirsuta TaxID=260670 RepID=A0AA40A222_9PEZI|nr:hypothetical protein B0H67DRAFT_647947 [Lasiosphaeris hirsuta]
MDSKFVKEYQQIMMDKNPSEAMRALFPTGDRLHEFMSWLNGPEDLKDVAPATLTKDKFVADVDKLNLLDLGFLDLMVPSMHTRLEFWVHVGRDEVFSYRIGIEPTGLTVTDKNDKTPNPFPSCILGLRSPSQRDPPFTFFQLGGLEFALVDRPSQSDDNMYWGDTGFFVVARLGPHGKMDGIYVVYDAGIREFRERGTSLPYYGLMPNPLQFDRKVRLKRFFCGRLGDSLKKINNPARHINWNDNIVCEWPRDTVLVSRD